MTVAHMKATQPATNHHGQSNCPEASFSKNPLRVHRPGNPRYSRAGVQGEYEITPSILSCRWEDQFMAECHKKPGQHLVRARLHGAIGTAQSLSRGKRHLQGHFSSQARPPSAESRRKEVAKQPRGDSLMRSSWPHSKDSRSRVQQHQSQMPGHQQTNKAPPKAPMKFHRHNSPSPSPSCPHCVDEGLHCSLSKLHLQPCSRNSPISKPTMPTLCG